MRLYAHLERSSLNISNEHCTEKWNIYFCPLPIFRKSYDFLDDIIKLAEHTRMVMLSLFFIIWTNLKPCAPRINFHDTPQSVYKYISLFARLVVHIICVCSSCKWQNIVALTTLDHTRFCIFSTWGKSWPLLRTNKNTVATFANRLWRYS
jgi:hypothetical protein